MQKSDNAELKVLSTTNRALSKASDVFGLMAGIIFLAIAVYICVDITTRSLFGFSSGATVEFTGFLLAIGMTWSFSSALTDRSHVRMDMFVNKLPVRYRAVLHVFAFLLFATFAWFVTWRCIATAMDSWTFGSLSLSGFRVPLSLPQFLWAGGTVLFAVFVTMLLLQGIWLLMCRRVDDVDKLLGQRTIAEEAAETLEVLKVEHISFDAERSK